MAAPHILIATPAYGANVKIQYMNSVMRTQQLLDRKGVKYGFLAAANAEIVAARNFLASFMYERPQFTHLLFVDADMAFAPASVEKLIAADKPLVGCICAKKKLDLPAFARALAKHNDETLARAAALEFVVRLAPDTKTIDFTNGLCRVQGIGMALSLIHRDVFNGLLASGELVSYAKHDFGGEGLQGPLHGFFDPIRDAEAGRISEDFSFCERWTKFCDGEVWALATETVDHIGDFAYGGSYMDHLKARTSQ